MLYYFVKIVVNIVYSTLTQLGTVSVKQLSQL